MNQQRCLDLRRVLGLGLAAIKRHGAAEVRNSCCQHVGNASAVTKSDDADFAGALRQFLQEAGRRNEIVGGFGRFKFGEQFPRFVLIAGIATQRK